MANKAGQPGSHNDGPVIAGVIFFKDQNNIFDLLAEEKTWNGKYISQVKYILTGDNC